MSKKRIIWAMLLLPPLLFYLALAHAPKPVLLDDMAYGKIVTGKKGEILKIGLNAGDKYRLPVSLDKVAPEAIQLLLLYEDRYFYWHPGVNPISMLRAAMTRLAGGRLPGASTITMQVARIKYNMHTSSIGGKLRQIWQALLLEYHYSKQEILEAYFNLAPYGGNIEGIEAASRIYFNKAASRLTLHECLALTVIPQNPLARHPVEGHDFDRARSRLYAMLEEGKDKNIQEAPPIHARSQAYLPFLAPHFSLELLRDKNIQVNELLTGIETDLQRLLDRSLKNFARMGAKYGLNNAAAMIVDAQSMQIAALAGSADFNNDMISGQIDGTVARRSPGSTLKPFIYALALDQGLIHPMTMLADSPRSFSGYDPLNFDRGFRGPVPAHEALKASRNLPAIVLNEKLKNGGLYDLLKAAHVQLDYGPEHYGLALTLGGAEINMREMASLYAMLVNRGIWQPIQRPNEENLAVPVRLLSPEAAWLTLWMLYREEGMIKSGNSSIPIYYKTGTSNGLRDAWTAGIVGKYVLIAWAGNFDNSSNPHLVGAETALPLFREIAGGMASMRHLEDCLQKNVENLKIANALVCKSTGDFNIEACASKVETKIISGVSPVRESGISRKILIDKETGLRACDPLAKGAQEIWWEFWPTDLREIFAEAGIDKPLPPQWLPECKPEHAANGAQLSASPPRIMLPKRNVNYKYRINDNNFQLPLQAAADTEISAIYWYADNQFIGTSEPGQVLFWKPAKTGRLRIRAVDNLGNGSAHLCDISVMP